MNKLVNVAFVALLLVAVAAVAFSKLSGGKQGEGIELGPSEAGLPRLIELGSESCVPCRMMEPIIEELRKEYAGKLQVDYVDTRKQTATAEKLGIRLIPTQVFLDAAGKELFRHTGYFPKAEILLKWKELGYGLGAAAGAAAAGDGAAEAQPAANGGTSLPAE